MLQYIIVCTITSELKILEKDTTNDGCDRVDNDFIQTPNITFMFREMLVLAKRVAGRLAARKYLDRWFCWKINEDIPDNLRSGQWSPHAYCVSISICQI